MTQTRYSIIFKKLAEVKDIDSLGSKGLGPFDPKLTESELDEISEIRRLALAISDPEPNSYTTT